MQSTNKSDQVLMCDCSIFDVYSKGKELCTEYQLELVSYTVVAQWPKNAIVEFENTVDFKQIEF